MKENLRGAGWAVVGSFGGVDEPAFDVSQSGLGPDNDACDGCEANALIEQDGRGFGKALGLNVGASAKAENYLMMYLR
jgi:hypothetical protein